MGSSGRPVLLLLMFVVAALILPSSTDAFTWTPCIPDPAPSADATSSSSSSSSSSSLASSSSSASPAARVPPPRANADADPAPPLLEPRTVTLTPDPPVIGSSVSFDIRGPLSSPVTHGTIGLRVKFEGVELYEDESDICDKLEGGCAPAALGVGVGGGGGGGGGQEEQPKEEDEDEAAIVYVQDLPPIAPPGHYSVRVVGTTGESVYDGDAVVCVDVDFEMVVPSSVSSAGDGDRVVVV
jgi:hypothetical protein